MTTNHKLNPSGAVTASGTVKILEEGGAWQVYAMRPVWMGSAASLTLANALAFYVGREIADEESDLSGPVKPQAAEEPAPAPEPSPLPAMPRTLAAMTDADREALRAQGIRTRMDMAAATVEAAFPTPAPAPAPVPVPPAPEPEAEPEQEEEPARQRPSGITIWQDGFTPRDDDPEPPSPPVSETGQWSEAEDEWLLWALRNDRSPGEIAAVRCRTVGSITGRRHMLNKQVQQLLVGRKRA